MIDKRRVDFIPAPELRPRQPYLRYVDIHKPILDGQSQRIYLTAAEIEQRYGLEDGMSDHDFVNLINEATQAIGEVDLADHLGVSRSTISRWVSGTNLACQALRDFVRMIIANYLTGRM
jgi:hypothetical protein